MLKKTLFFIHKCVRAISLRVLNRSLIDPRIFSNTMLRRYATIFTGRMVNVSGWDDRDKEGGYYKNYFKNASEYVITNVANTDKGLGSVTNSDTKEIELDLNKPIPSFLQRSFDVVLNHTTLEHVPDLKFSFNCLCELSRDVVILVVPVLQNIHITSTFGDYCRPTTLGVAKLFKDNGFELMVLETNDQPFSPIYCFAIGVRDSQKYKNKIEKNINFQMGRYLYGNGLKEKDLSTLLNKGI